MKQNWQYKIHNYSEAPPVDAWMNIANTLDTGDTVLQNNFAEKLSLHEVTPPPQIKKNIFDLLDTDDKQGFATRLFNYKEKVPATTWPRIVAALNKEEAKVISLNTSSTKKIYLRAAAAAAVLLITITFFVTNKPANNEPAVVKLQNEVPQVLPAAGTENKLPVAEKQEKNVPLNILTAQNKEAAPQKNSNTTTPAPVVNYTGNQTYFTAEEPAELAYDPALKTKDKLVTVTGTAPQDIDLINTPNSYINITGPDGQNIRVSAKFSNLIKYLTGADADTQEALDVIIKESARWRAVFADWREKMTNNIMAPSLTNFMDIIELSNVVEDKK